MKWTGIVVAVGVLVAGLAFFLAVPGAAGATADAPGGAPAVEPTGDLAASASSNGIEIRNVSVDPSEPYVDQPMLFEVTVHNDRSVPVKIQEVEVVPRDGGNQWVPTEDYANASDLQILQPGETDVVLMESTRSFEEAGVERFLTNVTVETRDPNTDENTTIKLSKLSTIQVQSPPPDPSLSIDDQSLVASEEGGQVVVTVTNDADVDAEGVELRLSGEMDIDDPQRSVSRVPANEEHRFVFNVSSDTAGDQTVGVQMSYSFFGNDHRTEARDQISFEEPEDPEVATLFLSEARTELEEDTVYITGRLGNRGDASANGVSLEVIDAQGIDPAQPNPRYFVDGGIPVDESATFDLYAEVDPDVEEIPIRVTYVSGGQEHVKVVYVEYNDGSSGSTGGDDDDAPPEEEMSPVAYLIGSLVALLALGVMGLAWRNVSGGDGGGDGAPVDPDSLEGGPPVGTGGPPAAPGVNDQHSQPPAGTNGGAAGYGGPGGPGPAGQSQGGQPHGQGQPQGGHAQGDPQGGNSPAQGGQPPAGRGQPQGGQQGHGNQPRAGHPPEQGDHPQDQEGQSPDGHQEQGGQPRDQGSTPRDGQPSDGAGRPASGGTGNGSGPGAGSGPDTGQNAGAGSSASTGSDPGPNAGSESSGSTASGPDSGAGTGGNAGPGTAGASSGAGGDVKRVRCDGCGDPFLPSELGTIALTQGNEARTCTTCRTRALEAAKVELGAGDHQAAGANDKSGVDELVSAMSDQPVCDGCGEAVPTDELEQMSLPDGSSAVSCLSCRKAALRAARKQLAGDD